MNLSDAPFPRLRPLGDTACIIEFGQTIDEPTHARVIGFRQALSLARAQGRWPAIVECVPAYTTLTVHFDATAPGDAALDAADALLDLARRARQRRRSRAAAGSCRCVSMPGSRPTWTRWRGRAG